MDSGARERADSLLIRRLLPDLEECQRRRRIIEQEVKDYDLLMDQASEIFAPGASEKCLMLDVGNGIYKEVQIDASSEPVLLVDIGLGTFVLFSFEEALRFCYERQYHLGRMQAFMLDRQSHIQAFIDKTLQCIQESIR
jgi:prefoldin subunit 5